MRGERAIHVAVRRQAEYMNGRNDAMNGRRSKPGACFDYSRGYIEERRAQKQLKNWGVK